MTARRTTTTPSTRRGYHHGDLRSALVEAAARMLETEGPEALSLRALARTAGVSQAAPYNHFESRGHLLATLAEAGFRELEATQRAAADAAASPEEAVRSLGTAYVRFARAAPQRYRLMFGAGVADWHAWPDVAHAKHASYQPIQDMLAALSADADARQLANRALAAWALVHGLAMLGIDGALQEEEAGAQDPDTLVADAIGLLVAGLGRR